MDAEAGGIQLSYGNCYYAYCELPHHSICRNRL
jgi:hypothetical protein